MVTDMRLLRVTGPAEACEAPWRLCFVAGRQHIQIAAAVTFRRTHGVGYVSLQHRLKGTPSIEVVAELARVSKATVSRVVNGQVGKVSDATRRRVQAAIKKLNYIPSRAGSALRSGRSEIVALVIPDRFNTYNQAIAGSLERALREHGKIMVLCTTDESPARQDEVLREMRLQLACGIVLLGAVESPGLRHAVENAEPIVLVNRRFPGQLAAPFIGTDNLTAAAAVADYFVANRLEPVTIVHGPLVSSATRERVSGFIERFRATAQRPDAVTCLALANFSKEEGYHHSRPLFSGADPPRSIFCTSDEIAYGVARAGREVGLQPGRDITLFGFDGSPINEFLAPWLGTVCVAHEAYGPAITSLLQAFWQGTAPDSNDELMIPYNLVPADCRSLAPHAVGRGRLPKRVSR
jgi:LacI family transcriptional regulator